MAIPYEPNCSAPPARPIPQRLRVTVSAGRTAAHERVHRHYWADANEQRNRIGVGAAGVARAEAIDHRIGADRHRREQGESDGPPVKARKLTAATQRDQQHAGSQQDDPGPTESAEPLADKCRGRDRGHQRGRAARDRIDLTHVAHPVALDQRREIDEMDQHRGNHPGPSATGRQADDWQHREPNKRSTDRDQGGGGKRIDAALDGRVPAGMAGGGKQHSGKNERVHRRNSDIIPRAARRPSKIHTPASWIVLVTAKWFQVRGVGPRPWNDESRLC